MKKYSLLILILSIFLTAAHPSLQFIGSTGLYDDDDGQNTSSTAKIIGNDKMTLSFYVKNTNGFEIAGSIIAQSGVKFDTCGSTGPTVNWGSKVLDQPPGFSWNNAFNMDTWEEVY